MIDVLFLTDKQVRAKLFERALKASRPVLVAQVRHDAATMKPIPEREPYLTLDESLGSVMDHVLVADEGKPESMWRDPVGDLAEALYPEDRSQAYLAAGNYFVLNQGRALAVVKKQASPAADVEAIDKVLTSIPRPRPSQQNIPPPPQTNWTPPSIHEMETPPPRNSREYERAAGPEAVVMDDPFVLLGIAQGTPRKDARKLFHTLIAQYHPDKVAHLAPEFRALAEEKTRVLLGAWQVVEPLCP